MRSIVRLHRRLFWIFMCRIWFALCKKNVFELCNYVPDISFYGDHLAAFNIIIQYVQRRMPFALKIFHWLRTSKNPLYRELQDCRPWLSFVATLLRQPENSTFHNTPRVLPKYLVLPRQNSARRTASPRMECKCAGGTQRCSKYCITASCWICTQQASLLTRRFFARTQTNMSRSNHRNEHLA